MSTGMMYGREKTGRVRGVVDLTDTPRERSAPRQKNSSLELHRSTLEFCASEHVLHKEPGYIGLYSWIPVCVLFGRCVRHRRETIRKDGTLKRQHPLYGSGERERERKRESDTKGGKSGDKCVLKKIK